MHFMISLKLSSEFIYMAYSWNDSSYILHFKWVWRMWRKYIIPFLCGTQIYKKYKFHLKLNVIEKVRSSSKLVWSFCDNFWKDSVLIFSVSFSPKSMNRKVWMLFSKISLSLGLVGEIPTKWYCNQPILKLGPVVKANDVV